MLQGGNHRRLVKCLLHFGNGKAFSVGNFRQWKPATTCFSMCHGHYPFWWEISVLATQVIQPKSARKKFLYAAKTARGRYPLLDRIDLHVEVPPVKFREMTGDRTGESSAHIRQRVMAA